jgi:alkanesulfonate monooxygenase SsuD/methylene tetrahydromethanopterin reductase-like flavin-dependent oxidoreductase (luciferase family)
MLDSQLDLTAQAFDYYRQQAAAAGWEAGPQHLGYMFKIHVDETEELAYETGRKLIEGAGNLFLDGSNGKPNPWAQNLPGLNQRGTANHLPTAQYMRVKAARGLQPDEKDEAAAAAAAAFAAPAPTKEEHDARRYKIWDSVLDRYAAVVGTPDSVLPKVRHVLETLRPGAIFIWHGDGDFTHEETMRGVRLMGEYVLPAIREIAKELELNSSFEVDPYTNQPVVQVAAPA